MMTQMLGLYLIMHGTNRRGLYRIPNPSLFIC